MTCLSPITAWKKRFADLTQNPNDYYNDKKLKFKKPGKMIIQNYEEVKIACGHCLDCRLDHANQWATRIILESKQHKKNCFVTLTYNNEHLPQTTDHKMTLQKKDLQDFVKRLRYELDKQEIKILYFACGEYGTTTYRPHYHAIIFGWQPDDLKQKGISKTENTIYTSPTLEKIWGNGYVAIQELNYKTACYTARYVQKKAGIEPQKRIVDTNHIEQAYKIDERNGKPFLRIKSRLVISKYDIYGREKEFLIMSKKPAIGLTYWNKNKEKIKLTQNIPLKIDDSVKIKPIPRYYKKKWENENIIEQSYASYDQKKAIEKTIKDNLAKINDPKPQEKYLKYIKSGLENRARFLKRNEI